ncbi:peroxidase [Tetranychus urticae]|uniref:peroxidase n=1 Tax=Tetranychus urticae TaxID=32264 RepID=UPI000D65188C|nr:peroxidase [Tetranychus urticae]
MINYCLIVLLFTVITAGQVIFPDGSRGLPGEDTLVQRRPPPSTRRPAIPQEPSLPRPLSSCPVNFRCSPLIQCQTIDLLNSDPTECNLETNKQLTGICCPKEINLIDNTTLPITAQFEIAGRRFETGFRLPKFPSTTIENAASNGLDWMLKKNLIIKRGSSASFHQELLGHSDEALQLSRNGELINRVGIELAKGLRLKGTEQILALRSISLLNSPIRDRCPPERPCPSTKYRQPDGSCNNLNRPTLGKALSPFGRLLPPDYADSIDAPRASENGAPLPSARVLSLSLLPPSSQSSSRYSLMLMVFGQFIDHDLTLTVTTRLTRSSGIQCCPSQAEIDPSLLHPACISVILPPDDPFYSQFRTNCMAVVRSAAAPRPGCQSGPREQLNQLSSFIDGGMIYGNSEDEERALRSGISGFLVTSSTPVGSLLPRDVNASCQSVRRSASCFRGGDGRLNEHPQLTVLHTIWLRQHNLIASELHQLNPGWSDEIIFQEAKRIVVAQLQHIIYSEFLPVILGAKVMKAFDLNPRIKGSTRYDPSTDPSIVSGFATAAYRLHTLVPGLFELRNDNNQVVDRQRLSNLFFNPEILYDTQGISLMVNGLTGQPSGRSDDLFTPELTNNLFKTRSSPFGMDLISINIQRGRDHGIPDYNRWREACGLRRASNFRQLADTIPPELIEQLASLYQSVDDIDLFVAGNLEIKLPGAAVGPVFACIIAEQFRRLKEGDRFWYEHGQLESSFSKNQLMQIRKTTLARILCDNGDISKVQPLTMLLPSRWNPKIDCRDPTLGRLDLTPWINEPVWSNR